MQVGELGLDKSDIQLVESQFVRTEFGLELEISQVHERQSANEVMCMGEIGNAKILTNKQCYKVTSKMSANQEFRHQDFRIQVAFSFRNLTFKPYFGELAALLSSEENAFGLAGGRCGH